jgi:zinc protease
MYRTLVVDQQLAAEAGASYSDDAISYGNFSVSLSPAPGVDLAKLEAAYDALLAQTLRDGITDADVERAKSRMQARLAYAKESPMGAAQQVGASLAIGMTIQEIETWPEEVKKVTPDQVRAAARKLTAVSSGTGILLPQPQVQAMGARP